eukprot:CAMPEP_0116881852 /NCGR_PEP_ID=MMETSP0463-20121206/13910_1 /TAXON_ID=181622 /ORGANISM="Strombidinopsis sp, Strain SopsisLIS2011" /LENGTH=61 /DNA_ID=CAMNT_0004534103 /DNA_START=300 /DNA_END=485 /DNA_ORIENTATION=+
MKHLTTMQEIIKGSAVEVLIQECIEQLDNMCKDYNAFEFMIMKQQLFKFFEDKHIKVSLFI